MQQSSQCRTVVIIIKKKLAIKIFFGGENISPNLDLSTYLSSSRRTDA
jgi:hypothetical protein